jgi:hypothetical protein
MIDKKELQEAVRILQGDLKAGYIDIADDFDDFTYLKTCNH